MPIFDYLCGDCGKTYEIFHKVREVASDIVCPFCTSANHRRLISAPNVAVGKNAGRSPSSTPTDDWGASCCGGACGLD